VDRVVVMGVSGSGKSTVGRALAEARGVPFLDADDLHPEANVAKMTAGIPLTDEDRGPWLEAVGAWLAERSDGVVACSALKRAYRDVLRASAPDARFVHLAADRAVVAERISHRREGGHFMPPSLLHSQYADLEPLGADELGLTIDVGSATPDQAVARALA